MPTDPTAPEALIVYPSRTKMVLLLLGALGFVAAGLWIATPSISARIATWKVVVAVYVGVPFFGACGLYAANRLIRRRPALIADRSGLMDAASVVGAGHLRWDEIDFVVPYEFSGQAMLGVVPQDLESLLARQNWVRKRPMKINVGMGATPVNIPQAILPMTVIELAETLHTAYDVRVEAEF